MKNGEKLLIVGCSGSGGPAAMMAKKLMPEVDVTVKETSSNNGSNPMAVFEIIKELAQ